MKTILTLVLFGLTLDDNYVLAELSEDYIHVENIPDYSAVWKISEYSTVENDVREYSTAENDVQDYSTAENDVQDYSTAENEPHEMIGEEATREKRSFYRSGKVLGVETSKTLDYLLTQSGYNRRVRPQFGGEPVQVNVNLAIRSMGPVDENGEVFSLDCYFRQTWFDSRLSFNTSGLSELALNWAFLAKIWKPDTFFVNGRQSFLHKITVPNRFVRISPSGKISYSQRLTIWAGCPMNLRKFPLDSQLCRLEIGSFGYTAEEVVYKWQANPASIDDGVSLAQFHLANWTFQENLGLSQRRTTEGFRNDSTVSIHFMFERQTGFFLLQIYTPLTLIVFCSWVSFWLVKTDKGGEVPARTALGATTVLSIVNLGFGGKSKPKVGYSTAMDIYIILCFVSVFAALVEFACINFIDTFIKRFKAWEEAEKKKNEAKEEEIKLEAELAEKERLHEAKEREKRPQEYNEREKRSHQYNEKEKRTPPGNMADFLKGNGIVLLGQESVLLPLAEEETLLDSVPNSVYHTENTSNVSTQDACVSTQDDEFEDMTDLEIEREKESYFEWFMGIYERLFEMVTAPLFRKYSPHIPHLYIYSHTLDVVYAVDDWARLLFPVVFLSLQVIYWSSYLLIF